MATGGETSKWVQSAIEQYRARREKEFEIERRVRKFEMRLSEGQRVAFFDAVGKSADELGIDLEVALAENQKRGQVRGKLIEAEYAQIRKERLALVQEEAKRIDKMRDAYLEHTAGWYEQRAGNPDLEFRELTSNWAATILEPTGRDYDLGDDMNVTDPGLIRFYPRASVYTGDNCDAMFVDFVQTVVFRNAGLEPGRGDFMVEEVRVDLSGVGLSQVRVGDACSLPRPARWDMTRLVLQVSVMQTGGIHDFESHTLVSRYLHRASAHGSESIIFLGGLRYHASYLLNGPAHGGGEILAFVDIRPHAFACEKYASSDLDFTYETTDGYGLRLTDGITLEGHYV